tara:strand:+ start:273 stop:431 length:159 start_codon:yes stop_codon:yes gene_type:complete
MKKYKIIKHYPIATIMAFTLIVYFAWKIIFSLIIAIALFLPIYLAVQVLNDN